MLLVHRVHDAGNELQGVGVGTVGGGIGTNSLEWGEHSGCVHGHGTTWHEVIQVGLMYAAPLILRMSSGNACGLPTAHG